MELSLTNNPTPIITDNTQAIIELIFLSIGILCLYVLSIYGYGIYYDITFTDSFLEINKCMSKALKDIWVKTRYVLFNVPMSKN